jgi:hypothetical protein
MKWWVHDPAEVQVKKNITIKRGFGSPYGKLAK